MKTTIAKLIALTLLGAALGVVQSRVGASYREPANIHVGVMHGILMPAALPGLLMGKDLPIYAPNNTGRPYNIGFILGINFCGTVFFGLGFWRGSTSASKCKSPEK